MAILNMIKAVSTWLFLLNKLINREIYHNIKNIATLSQTLRLQFYVDIAGFRNTRILY